MPIRVLVVNDFFSGVSGGGTLALLPKRQTRLITKNILSTAFFLNIGQPQCFSRLPVANSLLSPITTLAARFCGLFC